MKDLYDNTWDVVVVGGGPAGMMAAAAAAACGGHLRVALLEKNSELGRKMKIAGGGRCNFTNIASREQFLDNVPGGGKFLIRALSHFSGADCIEFFHNMGVATKVEQEGKVFPKNDLGTDLVKFMHQYLIGVGVNIFGKVKVSRLIIKNDICLGVATEEGGVIKSKAVILSTGGASYPGTGSSGDGYQLARQGGHNIKTPLPGLVSLCFEDKDIAKALQGLSIKDTQITLFAREKKLEIQRGDIIFTHFGLSGPAALKISRTVSVQKSKGENGLVISVDTVPKTNERDLLDRFLAISKQQPKKTVLNTVKQVVAPRLATLVLQTLGMDMQKKSAETGKSFWREAASLLKNFPVKLSGTRPLAEAMVTVGGVCTGEIDPKSMASRFITGLYFAGELLDVDAYTGGYNMHIAFSTGMLAGLSAVKETLN